jgi:predicted metalloprotease
MRWQGQRQSDNVEDRRAMGPGTIAVGGGIGTLLILLVVMLLGGNPQQVLEQIGQQQQQQAPGGGEEADFQETPEEKQRVAFVRTILASTEDVWGPLLQEHGVRYRAPTLVFFRGQTKSGCGFGAAAMGPFYCPADEKVYIDLSFFDELDSKLGAPGDFAQAYVIAHEVGHHVQKILGVSDQAAQARQRMSAEEYNALSVRVELQADFYAGVWAHHAQQMARILEPGDIEEGLDAANAIGDDTLQERSRGFAVPDSFTHGTSEQRVRWFRKGLETGDLRQGDTFKAREL